MSVHLITFSDENMDRASQMCVMTAKAYGEVDSTWIYEPGALARFRAEPKLLNERGCGYWWWKPQILFDAMSEAVIRLPGGGYRDLIDGDILIYSDAGIEFINNVHYIIDRMGQDIFLFGNNWEHAHWCKRDVVEVIWPDVRMGTVKTESDYSYRLNQMWQRFSKQVQASVIFFRVSDYSRKFVKEWLDWCLFEGGRLIDDSPSRTPNHPEFREHRHDQAILTTMAYRDGLKLHWWGARYNMDHPDGGFVYPKLPEHAADDYEPFVHHHRRRNHEWEMMA